MDGNGLQAEFTPWDVDPRLFTFECRTIWRNATLGRRRLTTGKVGQTGWVVCLLYLLPHCLSVVTDVVATASHRAWTTNRVFPTD